MLVVSVYIVVVVRRILSGEFFEYIDGGGRFVWWVESVSLYIIFKDVLGESLWKIVEGYFGEMIEVFVIFGMVMKV